MKTEIKPDKSTLLYDDTIRVDFYQKRGRRKHLYVVTDLKTEEEKEPMSVTKVIGNIEDKSFFLVAAAVKLAKEGKDHREEWGKAAELGTQVHYWIESFIKSDKKDSIPMPNGEAGNCVRAFIKWYNKNKPKYIGVERLIYSREYNYCGLIDGLFTLPSENHKIVHIQDFKTSKSVYGSYRFQVCAYKEAFKEMNPGYELSMGDNQILRLDKESGEYEEAWYGEHEKDFPVIGASVIIHNRLNELKPKALK